MGQLYRELGQGKRALPLFDQSLVLDPAYLHALHLKGICYHGLGQTRRALEEFRKGLSLDPTHVGCNFYAGICLQALGRLHDASDHYSAVLAVEAGHNAWYSRELTTYYGNKQELDFRSFNADSDLDPYLKEVGPQSIFHGLSSTLKCFSLLILYQRTIICYQHTLHHLHNTASH